MKEELDSFAYDVASQDAAKRFADVVQRDLPLPEMLNHLAALTGEAPGELSHAFGRRLFERFVVLYPDFIPTDGDLFAFLLGLERHVHVEMRALYPDANPPRLICEEIAPTRLRLTYQSDHPAEEMCAGMLHAAVDHFGAEATIVDDAAAAGADAVFTITLTEAQGRAAA